MKTIRHLRQARGWTQFELALRVGVQPQAVYLLGERPPQVAQLRKLGELFGLCSDEIALVPAPGGGGAPHRARADRLDVVGFAERRRILADQGCVVRVFKASAPIRGDLCPTVPGDGATVY